MQLSELFGRAGLECPREAEKIEVKNIVTDSRRVEKGSLFICLRGKIADGHEYMDEAIRSGASVIVAEQVRDACVGGAAAIVLLDNTRSVSARLYNAWYGNPTERLKIVGVTGTNGKTSVSTMLYEVFTALGYRAGLIGTVQCLSVGGKVLKLASKDPLANMTTPDPEELYYALSQLERDGAEYVFMEVSSHALALHKVDAIQFELGVFTNLSRDHLDFHGTMEEYFKAKQRLFELSRRGLVNTDSEYGKSLVCGCSCPILTASEISGDFCAHGIKYHGAYGSECILKYPGGECEINIPLAGEFLLTNSILCASAAIACGLDPKGVASALFKIKGAEGRMERVKLPTDEFSVIIDYAHTPDALEKLLKSILRIREPSGHTILVFGCGGDRDRTKRKEMGQIASRLADFVIITSDNSRGEDPERIFSDILTGIDKEKPYCLIKDRKDAIESAVLTAKHGDIIVLAGKGHERYEIALGVRRPFDERKIVKTAFKKRN